MLFVSSVSCERAGKKIFKDVNIKLREGRILQIVANNGVGKTSLLRMLCGLLPTENGFIKWGCVKKNKIYIGNKQSLHKNLTPKENLEFHLSLIKGSKDISIKKALSYFNICIDDTICGELSTGQRQRVLLAKLLLIESNLWFLDEPFLFLDKEGIIKTKNIIFNFVKLNNIVVITTHAVLTDLLTKSIVVYL